MIELLPDAWACDEAVLVDAPKPVFWRILVMCRQPKKASAGGIVYATETQDNESTLDYVGKVVALGALAYKHERLQGEPNVPKVGDYVAYGRYAGQKISVRGVNFLILNDDEVLSVVPNPDALRIYV